MKKKIILIIIVLGLICSAAVISAVIWKNAPAQKQKKQLELGNRYLEEMNYEQAKVVFEELITIDPSNVEAYLGAVKAYVGLEDYEGAVAVLQEGYDQTGSEEIKAQLEEYEQKLEEQKAEAEQALREEIEEYMKTIPVTGGDTDNPIYTYSYLKKIYPDVEAKLQEYLKKTTDERSKTSIYCELNLMALSVNDMEKAREYRNHAIAFFKDADEYGRHIGPYETEGGTQEYFYYEGSSRLKTVVVTEIDENGQTQVDEWEYNSYDAEGRVVSMTVTTTGPDYNTVDGINVEEYPGYPGYLSKRTTTYHYEENISYALTQASTVGGTGYDGPDNRWVMLNEYEEARLSTYDDEGHLISFEDYDEAGNLEDRREFEYDEKWKKTAIRDYDEAGNLTRRVEFDTEGNVISDTTY